MILTGVVREYHPEDGWGVIDAVEVPGGCWVHFSAIEMPGFRTLAPGQIVTFVPEPARQDGFAHRAVRAWPGTADPASAPTTSVAYQSTLTLTFDPPKGAPED